MIENPDITELHDRLQRWLAQKLPDRRGLALSPLSKPSSGFSNDTLVCDITHTEGEAQRREPLVVRLHPDDFQLFPEYDLPGQCRIMLALEGRGLPVPHVRWLEEDERVAGRPFYVMDRVAGDVPPDVPPYHAAGVFAEAAPDQRARMWWSGIETLSRVHALDWQSAGLSFLGVPAPGAPAAGHQLDYYERFLDWAEDEREPQPILRAALQWLRRNAYTGAAVSLCWGDSRPPNIIYQGTEIAAMLDWEMAFLGDPEADLAWWLFMDWFSSSGYEVPRLEGLPGPQETVRRYEELTGSSVRHLAYNELFAAFRFGVIMVRVAALISHRGMPLPSPDFASNNAVTRRIAQTLELPPPGAV